MCGGVWDAVVVWGWGAGQTTTRTRIGDPGKRNPPSDGLDAKPTARNECLRGRGSRNLIVLDYRTAPEAANKNMRLARFVLLTYTFKGGGGFVQLDSKAITHDHESVLEKVDEHCPPHA